MPTFTNRKKITIKQKVLQCLASGDISMQELCQQEGMPSRMTIYRWQSKDSEFAAACDAAEKGGYDLLATRILNQFDDLDFKKISTKCASMILTRIKSTIGKELSPTHLEIIETIVNENALDPRFASAEVNKVTNQFKAVMDFLSKRHPSRYGQKLEINQNIDDKRSKTKEELEEDVRILLDRRKKLVGQQKKLH